MIPCSLLKPIMLFPTSSLLLLCINFLPHLKTTFFPFLPLYHSYPAICISSVLAPTMFLFTFSVSAVPSAYILTGGD